jgi:hypothetical protein
MRVYSYVYNRALIRDGDVYDSDVHTHIQMWVPCYSPKSVKFHVLY